MTWVPAARRWHASKAAVGAGFTLIELMVVIGILGLVMTVAIPSIYRAFHPESIQKAVNDLLEACNQARARAILQGTPMDLVIRAEGGGISIQPAAGGSAVSDADAPEQPAAGTQAALEPPPMVGRTGTANRNGGGNFSGALSDEIAIELMEVNFENQMDYEEAHVRFYPNGTSDEFKMIIFRPKTGERRMLSLEVVTGLAEVESDPSKWR